MEVAVYELNTIAPRVSGTAVRIALAGEKVATERAHRLIGTRTPGKDRRAAGQEGGKPC